MRMMVSNENNNNGIEENGNTEDEKTINPPVKR